MAGGSDNDLNFWFNGRHSLSLRHIKHYTAEETIKVSNINISIPCEYFADNSHDHDIYEREDDLLR